METTADHPEDDAGARNPVDRCGLSPVEELRRVVADGRPVRRGRGEPAAEGNSWGDERKLPAELLYELLARPESGGPPRAAILVGVRITGRLDYEAAELRAPLFAHGCYFDEPVNLVAARAAEIRFTACHIPGIAADRLETRGDLDLSHSTIEVLALSGARIGGRLGLDGVTLTSGSYPFNLGYDPRRSPGSPSDRLDGAALIADGLQVDQDTSCEGGFTAAGKVRLRGAHIGGQLSLNSARLAKGFTAQGLRVDHDMLCGKNFKAEGEIRMRGAHIGGLLFFGGATLKRLSASALEVQTMLCRDDFKAQGEVRLHGAHIAGQLEFDGATFDKGLDASRLRVDENMFCRNNFTAMGEVRLRGAHIGGDLEFGLARLARGLIADGLRVDHDLSFAPLFEADGPVRLRGAQIGRELSFDGATLADGERALNLKDIRVDGDVSLRFAGGRAGEVDLTGARLGTLFDSEETWPMRLRLRGCVYAGMEAAEDAREQPEAPEVKGRARRPARRRSPLQHGAPPDLRRRLRWIALAEEGPPSDAEELRRPGRPLRRLGQRTGTTTGGAGYAPQPYTQLMAFNREDGRDGDARQVAFARERRRRSQLGLPGRLWNCFLQWTVGYGYKPLRALVLLAVLVTVGALTFSSFHSDGDLTAVREGHPPFVASIYTIDRLIPVLSFGLRDAFAASRAAQWWAFTYTLLGWALTIAIVAGITAAVRRD